MLYLFVGKEAKKNNGLAPDVDVDDINKIDFEAKGLYFHIEMIRNRQRKFNLVLTPHFSQTADTMIQGVPGILICSISLTLIKTPE